MFIDFQWHLSGVYKFRPYLNAALNPKDFFFRKWVPEARADVELIIQSVLQT